MIFAVLILYPILKKSMREQRWGLLLTTEDRAVSLRPFWGHAFFFLLPGPHQE